MSDKNTIIQIIKSLNLIPEQAVSAVILDQGSAGIIIDLDVLSPMEQKNINPDHIRVAIEEKVNELKDITSVSVILTREKKAPKAAQAAGGLKKAPDFNQPKARSAPTPDQGGLKGVRHVVAVASGKGGVGKSTTAVNLAMALNKLGHTVGILDADIFGPSLPKLLGVKVDGRPPIIDGVIQPVVAHGMKTMSIGYMVDEDQPVVWRGPKVMGAIQQLFKDVDWSGTDILILDLPPGTGDVQLSIAQQVKLSGAVIVSTPQDLALLDAKKGLKMFEMVNIPIFGILENMSHFICPNCGEESHIFGHGGTQRTATAMGTKLIGQIPLHMSLRADAETENGDSGEESQAAFMHQDEAELTADTRLIYSEYIKIAQRLEEQLK